MSGFRIEGNTSGNVLEVTTNNEIKSALTLVDTDAGHVSILAESDSGTITGSRLMRSPEVSQDFKIRAGLDTLVFNEIFPGTILNSGIWTAPATTMTAIVAGNFQTLNAGLSVASGAVARLQSYRHFPIFGPQATYVELGLQFSQLPVNGNFCEWGVGLATGTSAPTDGIFFRVNSSGEFRCIINYGGSEVQSGTLDFSTLVGINTNHVFLIYAGNKSVDFWIDDILIATVEASNSGFGTTASMNLPIFVRTYNSIATAAAQTIKIGYASVQLSDGNYSKPYMQMAAGAGWHSSLTQTGATTIGQTAVWTNSANPTAAAPTNTTAALGSGLGGIFIANINGLAVTTDFVISSYQVPLGTATFPGKGLYITGIGVSAVNTVVANGAGPTTWALALAYGHTAVSLATSESSTTKAPRRFPLGIQTLAAAAAVGQPATNDTINSLSTPIFVQPGEFVQVIMRFISNNSAATEAVNFYIRLEGHFE